MEPIPRRRWRRSKGLLVNFGEFSLLRLPSARRNGKFLAEARIRLTEIEVLQGDVLPSTSAPHPSKPALVA
jgi:hypothetical protein